MTSAVQKYQVGRDGDDILHGDNGSDHISGGKGADKIWGYGGDDTLDGNRGSDRVDGGGGDDIVTGGKGDDTLIGGGGQDTFIFSRDDDKDVIKDFNTSDDTILLEGFGSNKNSFNEIMNHASNEDGNVVIDLGSGDVLTLNGLSKSDLSSDDFSFG
ncbi:calcium-binding protein [Flexibacterium corallicola]|uniref:calcium-binding protein n=1 Tax=Flexibacterium corallicola TaxID=3037259 RepID=UPI00286EC74A|nr:hypothetical protein [Pseudovibrio sp. M1P-2-3]